MLYHLGDVAATTVFVVNVVVLPLHYVSSSNFDAMSSKQHIIFFTSVKDHIKSGDVCIIGFIVMDSKWKQI